MDLLTQGLLGGVLAQSVAGREEKGRAAFTGVVAGLAADADVLIFSSSDPLLTLEYHRHFTHALTFIPVGAAISMLLLWPFMRRRLPPGRLYRYCLAGYSMSGILDACTSYGTHLYWPFSDEQVAWRIISIVDPVFTLVLLVTFIAGLNLRKRPVAGMGLSLCLLYLVLGYIQLQRAEAVAGELIDSRGHAADRLTVKPTLGNLLLWRSLYIHEGRIYVDAVRVGAGTRIFEGESVEKFSPARDLPRLEPGSVLYGDIERFTAFSEGYVALQRAEPHVLGDIRYSMLPHSVEPLWGIVFDPARPGVHADYRFFRDHSPETRQTFLDMLF